MRWAAYAVTAVCAAWAALRLLEELVRIWVERHTRP